MAPILPRHVEEQDAPPQEVKTPHEDDAKQEREAEAQVEEEAEAEVDKGKTPQGDESEPEKEAEAEVELGAGEVVAALQGGRLDGVVQLDV